MTREEAKREIDDIDFYLQHYTDDYGERSHDAMMMAIQALSQEPCDDAISRDMALEKMADYVASGYADSAEDFEEYSRIICQLPSVTQKSKTGHWIETEYHRWRCSICREKGMSEWDNIHNVRTNFCPNCGAKMGSEDKE